MQTKTVLVLGATGGVGGAVAEALARHGWQVRGLARDAAAARARLAAFDWRQGDAMRREDVVAAAEGVQAIVHAVNPPGYSHWEDWVLPMIDNTIAAARAAGGARVVLPGTLYNFDPARTPVVTSDTPQTGTSRKGRIRIALEERLRAAAPEVPVLILRAGDFFGPGTRSSWFSQAMLRPGRPVTWLFRLPRGPGHTWAYLPDLAEAFARLMEAPLAPFERVQFAGVTDETGHDLRDAIARVTGHRPRELPFPWFAFRLLAPFGGFPREVAEVIPHWRHPLRLDNTRLKALIGAEPHTPLDQAMRATLVNLGCLAAQG